jgi:hypothetical protein
MEKDLNKILAFVDELNTLNTRYFDPNFIENHLKGWETMLELKINF